MRIARFYVYVRVINIVQCKRVRHRQHVKYACEWQCLACVRELMPTLCVCVYVYVLMFEGVCERHQSSPLATRRCAWVPIGASECRCPCGSQHFVIGRRHHAIVTWR